MPHEGLLQCSNINVISQVIAVHLQLISYFQTVSLSNIIAGGKNE